MIIGIPELAISASALIASFTSGLSGFAFGMVALSLWLHFLDPIVAGPLVVLCSLTGQLITALSLHRSFRPDLFWPFVMGGAFGIPFGIMILKIVEPAPLKRGFGLFLVVYSTYALLRRSMKPMLAGGRLADGGVGMVGGVMGGLAGLSGVIPVLWCDLRGWGKEIGRGVYQPFNIAMQALALAGMAFAGLLSEQVWMSFAICAPAVVLGTFVGLRLYAKIDERQFRRIVLWLVLVSGFALVV